MSETKPQIFKVQITREKKREMEFVRGRVDGKFYTVHNFPSDRKDGVYRLAGRIGVGKSKFEYLAVDLEYDIELIRKPLSELGGSEMAQEPLQETAEGQDTLNQF